MIHRHHSACQSIPTLDGGRCSSQSLTLWMIIWFSQINEIESDRSNYFNKLRFCCNILMYSSDNHLILHFSLLYWAHRQHAALVTSCQHSAVITTVRTEAHLCTQFHNTEVIQLVTTMTAPLQWRALFEIPLPGSYLWHADSYKSPFVLTLTRNMM